MQPMTYCLFVTQPSWGVACQLQGLPHEQLYTPCQWDHPAGPSCLTITFLKGKDTVEFW